MPLVDPRVEGMPQTQLLLLDAAMVCLNYRGTPFAAPGQLVELLLLLVKGRLESFPDPLLLFRPQLLGSRFFNFVDRVAFALKLANLVHANVDLAVDEAFNA